MLQKRLIIHRNIAMEPNQRGSISGGLTIDGTGQDAVAQQQSRSELLEEGKSMFRLSPSGSI